MKSTLRNYQSGAWLLCGLLIASFAGCSSSEEENDLPLAPKSMQEDKLSNARYSDKDILKPEAPKAPETPAPTPSKGDNRFPD